MVQWAPQCASWSPFSVKFKGTRDPSSPQGEELRGGEDAPRGSVEFLGCLPELMDPQPLVSGSQVHATPQVSALIRSGDQGALHMCVPHCPAGAPAAPFLGCSPWSRLLS